MLRGLNGAIPVRSAAQGGLSRAAARPGPPAPRLARQPVSTAVAAPLPELPGVSVLVPARDEAASLPEALRALAAQDYDGPMEVIVADGSDGPATAEAACAALPGVRVVANPARIAAAGVNRALAAARHPVAVRCDARCVLPPDYVRRAVAALGCTGAANVGGRLEPVGDTPFERAVALAMSSRLGSGGPRYRTGGAPGPVDTVPLGAFRREALEAAGGFDATLARNEDYELNWRLRAAGGTVWFEPALSVRYRPRGTVAALARQYFDYGRWKRVVLRRHPRSLRARQLAAPALVLALIASAALALLGVGLRGAEAVLAGALPWAAAAVPLAWVGALACVAAARVLGGHGRAALAMPMALAVMHLAWGAGFLMPAPDAGERR